MACIIIGWIDWRDGAAEMEWWRGRVRSEKKTLNGGMQMMEKKEGLERKWDERKLDGQEREKNGDTKQRK